MHLGPIYIGALLGVLLAWTCGALDAPDWVPLVLVVTVAAVLQAVGAM